MSDLLEALHKKYVIGKEAKEREKEKKIERVVRHSIELANGAAASGSSDATFVVEDEIADEVEKRLRGFNLTIQKPKSNVELEGKIRFEISGWAYGE